MKILAAVSVQSFTEFSPASYEYSVSLPNFPDVIKLPPHVLVLSTAPSISYGIYAYRESAETVLILTVPACALSSSASVRSFACPVCPKVLNPDCSSQYIRFL